MDKQCVMVGDRELNAAIKTLTEAGHIDFIEQMGRALTNSREYGKMVETAVSYGLDEFSVGVGFKAGLRAASVLGNFNYQFLEGERDGSRNFDSSAGSERSLHVGVEHQSGSVDLSADELCGHAIHG
jgi:hypothetical protein